VIGNRIDHFPVGEHAQLDRAEAKIIEQASICACRKST
jgi:hypothetical protein